MLERLRPRSAYDVIALLALFVAVGTGGAYAANTIASGDIIDGEVKNPDIAANAMTSSKLANGSVQNSDLGPDAVTTSKLKAGNVGTTDIADNAVTGAKVQESTLGPVPQADTLDGFDWTFFAQAGATATNSELLDGLDSEDFLGATATAADSEQLDGLDSRRFARLGGLVNGDGSISQGTGFTVTHPGDGEYQVSFPAGTLASELCPPVVTAIPFAGLVRHPQLSGRVCSGLGAGSFTIKLLDSEGVAHDTPFMFIAM